MNKYKWKCTSESIWGSFDHGVVEANTIEEAKRKATYQLLADLERVNDALKTSDNTQGFSIEVNIDNIIIEQI